MRGADPPADPLTGGPGAGARRVGMLTLALAAASAVWLPLVAHRHAPHPTPLVVAGLLALLFAATEVLLIHLPWRRDTHTVSFSELPLALGVFLLAPVPLVAASVVGSGLALGVRRRQRGVKLAFNVTQVGLQALLAVTVFDVIRGAAAIASPHAYLAATVGVLAADLASASLVTLAIALFRGTTRGGLTSWMLLAGLAGSVAKIAIALLAVSAVAHGDPFALLLFAICAGCMYAAFRAYASLHERHQRLEMLYRFTSAVGGSVHLDAIANAVVAQACNLLRTTRAELCVQTRPGTAVGWSVDGDELVVRRPARPVDDDVWQRVVGRGERVARDDVLAIALTAHAGPIGYLTVSGRLGVDTSFDAVDARLFEALANHAAIALENGRLVEQLETEMRQREHRAAHDGLTGLVNRTSFSEGLDLALRDADGAHALFVLGLDHFSDVNETLGHDNGDIVLCEVAKRLQRAIPGATIARLGGDEFAVLSPEVTTDADLRALGDTLVAAVTPRITIEGLTLEAGISIGVALAPDHANDAVGLLRCADTAMRRAKARRSGFEIYEPGAEGGTRRRLTLAHQLRQAIERRELTLYYQPKIDVETGRTVGVEALARWMHGQHGFLPPDEFIPIAEHTGLIDPLTVVVLDGALAQRRAWAEAGIELDVAVNVSARSLVDRTFADRVTRALVRNRCPVDALTIEITETQLMADPDGAASALQELHDLGVRVSIDDLGTGFSSLSSLRALPLDEVKIDKSFVLGATRNDSDAAIVRSTVALGRSLGLHVVAEGVENAETLAFLAACGVHAAQGFYFASPLPPEMLERWLRTREPAQVQHR